MSKVIFTNENKEVKVKKSGETILALALKARISIRHKCGGKGSCATCKVQIGDQANVNEPNQIEKKLLSSTQLAQGFRLGCQTKVSGAVSVQVPEDPLKAKIRALLAEEKANKLDE